MLLYRALVTLGMYKYIWYYTYGYRIVYMHIVLLYNILVFLDNESVLLCVLCDGESTCYMG